MRHLFLAESIRPINEETGVLSGLEPLGNYLLEMLWQMLEANVSHYEEGLESVKRKVTCENWYNLDKLANIEIDWVKNYSDSDVGGSVIVGMTAEFFFNYSYLARKSGFLEKGATPEVKDSFLDITTHWMAHEVTHLAERASQRYNTNSDEQEDDRMRVTSWHEKGPSYDEEIMTDTGFDFNYAFSESEINARVNQFFFSITKTSKMRDKVLSWTGNRHDLIKSLINDNARWLYTGAMEDAIYTMKGASEGDGMKMKYARSFITSTANAVLHTHKNTFGINPQSWRETDDYDEPVPDVRYSNKQLMAMAGRIFRRMNVMYKKFRKRLYSVGNMAVENVLANAKEGSERSIQ